MNRDRHSNSHLLRHRGCLSIIEILVVWQGGSAKAIRPPAPPGRPVPQCHSAGQCQASAGQCSQATRPPQATRPRQGMAWHSAVHKYTTQLECSAVHCNAVRCSAVQRCGAVHLKGQCCRRAVSPPPASRGPTPVTPARPTEAVQRKQCKNYGRELQGCSLP